MTIGTTRPFWDPLKVVQSNDQDLRKNTNLGSSEWYNIENGSRSNKDKVLIQIQGRTQTLDPVKDTIFKNGSRSN